MLPTDSNEPGPQGEATASSPEQRFSAATLLAINALAIAFIAALFVQALHEISHGTVAWMAGARWEWFSLFSVSITGSSPTDIWAELAIAGSPAILSILIGTSAMAVFEIRRIRHHPGLRLLTYYIAAFSLFTGFSSLLFDPIVYRAGQQTGDWQQVIALLKGDWMIRSAISLIGAAGMLRSLSWLAQSTLRFSDPLNESPNRTRLALPLLMIPYVGVNLSFTLLSIGHSGGTAAATHPILTFWVNTMGLFWAFFLVAYWMGRIPSPAESIPLPRRVLTLWCIMAALGLALAGLALLPKLSVG